MKKTLLIGFTVLFFCITSGSAQMTIHHIDVAQGDVTLIEFQTAAVLVDAGGSRRNAVRDHLVDYLDKFFQRRSDLNRTLYSVIVSHPHADHLWWLMPVLEKYKVLNLVDNGEQRDSVGSTTRMKQARAFFAQQAAANPLTRFYNRIDSADITPNGYVTRWFQDLNVREPLAEVVFLAASRSCSNPNNGSVVVRFKYGETKILVTGDAEDEADGGCLPAIPRMIQQLSDGTLDVDVYKVGHHASPNGTNLEYLQEMSPRISVISAGGPQDSDAIGFGHPRIDTIRLIMDGTSGSRTPPKAGYGLTASRQRHGVREDLTISKAVYCTCWDGDIQIPTDAAGRLLPVITSR